MDANMSEEGQTKDNCSTVELELYFLIAKFLSNGPCTKAAEVLQAELEEHKLLPKRVDWKGGKRFRSFDSLNKLHPHIGSTHLMQICERIGPILDKELPPNVKGVLSLLGAGRQSLLRNKQAIEKTVWKGSTHAVCKHGRGLLSPINMIPSPNMFHLVNAHQISGTINGHHMKSNNLYSKMSLMTRALGHLSAVYCVSFDRSGQYIITGADDHLIKLWSANTGRLLSTLRGHAAEITDMAVNYENTMLATGSCDKQIRVWCLKTVSPIAVLQGHTGMITSLQGSGKKMTDCSGKSQGILTQLKSGNPFSPMVRKDTRFLMSTGGDGCVCFWQWNLGTQKFNPKPIKFIERSRAGAQMLCSSFSPGGIFLATGSADQVIRVYCFSGVYPEKICELEAHTDQVDSIQYANNCDKFVSGSKDGTARLWRYERQTWKAILLNMGQKLPGDASANNAADDKKNYTVTMIEWTNDDTRIITAVNDNSLKIWDSNNGQLMSVLKGHQDEVYVLENNPADPRILLSAGHDGHIILWDLNRGTQIMKNFNSISGQGHGAVFDCKWSPDGMSFATTDSHGYMRLFGLGSNEKFKHLPEEYFFHTDYRPLIRDQHGYVLDEQTQQAPHLMPPPFLVDIDGNPHPPHLQRLVTGRENCTNNQLIPQIGITPSGDREVLDSSIAEVQNNNDDPQREAAVANADEEAEGPRQLEEQQPQAVAGPSSSSAAGQSRDQDLDSLIARMQRDMDMRLPRDRGGEPLASPPRGNIQHQADGAVRVISVVPGQRRHSEEPPTRSKSDKKGAKISCVVTPLDPSLIRQGEEWRLAMAEAEIKYYQTERKKRPPLLRHDSTDSGSVGGMRHTRQQRRRPNSRRTRQSRNEETGRNRLTTRALYDTDVEDDEIIEDPEARAREDEERDVERGENANSGHDDDEEEEAAIDSEDQMWNSDNKSDSDSSDYSDWTPDGNRNMAPPKRRSQRQMKRKRFSSCSEDEDDDDDDDDETEVEEEDEKEENEDQEEENNEDNERRSSKRKKTKPVPPKQKKVVKPRQKRARRTVRNRPRAQQGIENTANLGEVPEEYKPPDWLTETLPHKAPYYPQIGDEIMYFRQGHENYVKMCKLRKAYDINPSKNQPWHKTELREQELVKVVGIKYEIKPPRLVCLKLAMIDPVTSKHTGASFTVKYHDMPDVIDFLVLRQTYNTAVQRKWKVTDRFRSIIDNAWWCGTINNQEPLQVEYPDSLFQSYHVQWDNGETERMSPWDFEPLLPENEPDEVGASVVVQHDELKEVLYSPQEGEWPDHGMGTECERIIRGLEQVMELSVAENFIAPVDLNAYPDYAMIIEYPIDLSTIKARLENRFYRRTAAVMYDVRLLEGNTKKYNLPVSHITKCATLVTELLLRFIRDTDIIDVMPLYSELAKDSDFSIAHAAVNHDDEEAGPSAGRTRSLSGNRRSSSVWDANSWKEECSSLTQDLLTSEDSGPFRQPVDVIEVPDYLEIVETPMDLTTVLSKFEGDMYSTPNEFANDIRLIFANSKAYNTNKRSRIYAMTLRLSAKFEEKMNDIMEMWKRAKRYGKSAPNARRKSSSRLSIEAGEGSSGLSHVGTSNRTHPCSSAASSASATSPVGHSYHMGASSSARRRVGSSNAMAMNSRSRGGASESPAAGAAASSSSRCSPPIVTTRSGRAVKRKKVESDSEATEIDSDVAESSRARRPPNKKSARTTGKAVNGYGKKRGYSTRNRTGATKRKRYQDNSSFDEASDSEEESPIRKRKGNGKSSSRGPKTKTRTSPRKSESRTHNGYNDDTEEDSEDDDESDTSESDSDTETDSSNNESEPITRSSGRPRGRPPKRHPTTSRRKVDSSEDESGSTSNSSTEDSDGGDSTDKHDSDSDSDSDSDTDSQGGRNVSRRMKRSSKQQRSRETVRRTSQRPKQRTQTFDPELIPRSRRNTRNQGRRTVRYDEDSDEEAQLVKEAEEADTDATDDYSDPESAATTVSSRGRVCRMTPKARASLLGVS